MPLTLVEWEKLAEFILANFVEEHTHFPHEHRGPRVVETLPPLPHAPEIVRALDGLHEAIRENTAAVIRSVEASGALVAKLGETPPRRPGRPSNAEREAMRAAQNEPPPPKPGPGEPMFEDLDPKPPADAGEAQEASPPPAAAVDDKSAPASAEEAPREAAAVVEAPAPAAAAEPPGDVSEQDVKRQLRLMQQRFPADGIARITKILKPFGTARFSDLSPEHYGAVFAAVQNELR